MDRATLWCEHSRLPLPLLNREDPRRGVYEVEAPRTWFVQAAPFLNVLSATLGLVLPVAAAASKLALDENDAQKHRKQLDFGKQSADALLKSRDKALEWAGESTAVGLEKEPGLRHKGATRAEGAVLRQLQAWLKDQDPGFGGPTEISMGASDVQR